MSSGVQLSYGSQEEKLTSQLQQGNTRVTEIGPQMLLGLKNLGQGYLTPR